jgi:sporulation protein YlmC with PRC-barrel domain
MKRTVFTAIALAVVLGVAAPGFAADKKDRHDRTTFSLDGAHMDSKDLIGMRVEFPDGKRAGKIDHLLFDRDGKATHAVIAMGGFAGVGRKEVVVPWSQVRIRHLDKKDVAMVDRATLDTAPRYSRRDRDRMGAASPATAPSADRDKDGVPNKYDRAPSNPARQ